MQVNPSSITSTTTGAIARPTAQAATKTERDQAEFGNVKAIDDALQATPDSRPEAVTKAQELIQDVNYPPAEGIRRLARLFAVELTQRPSQS